MHHSLLLLEYLTDVKLVVEKVVFPMPTLNTALQCCFASFYMYNIAYPPNVVPFMIFLEYVFQTGFSQKVPLCVSTIIDNLEKL